MIGVGVIVDEIQRSQLCASVPQADLRQLLQVAKYTWREVNRGHYVVGSPRLRQQLAHWEQPLCKQPEVQLAFPLALAHHQAVVHIHTDSNSQQ